VDALQAAGVEIIFQETASGAWTDRVQLPKAIGASRIGDTLMVTLLDRLAGSTRDLLNTLDAIAKRGATFKSLADAWADTTTAHGRLLLTVLGGLAESERELIRVRAGEGRRRAAPVPSLISIRCGRASAAPCRIPCRRRITNSLSAAQWLGPARLS
jgi:DNA invertase Pin-like site-specific DNA recombinase